MKTGDEVKFVEENQGDIKAREAGIKMIVVWIDEPRMMIRLINARSSINATMIFNTSDMVKVL